MLQPWQARFLFRESAFFNCVGQNAYVAFCRLCILIGWRRFVDSAFWLVGGRAACILIGWRGLPDRPASHLTRWWGRCRPGRAGADPPGYPAAATPPPPTTTTACCASSWRHSMPEVWKKMGRHKYMVFLYWLIYLLKPVAYLNKILIMLITFREFFPSYVFGRMNVVLLA